MDDNSIFGLRKPLPRCKHLRIYRRKFGYSHHIFVGEADVSGCDIYHYSISLLPLLKMCPPAQIKKERLEYSSYMENKDIMKIFNWNNGVIIVNRDDYPENEIAENECIAKAESRLGETNYSIPFNNCESYINWIFSGDNTSNEFRNASLLTQITLNVLEESIYTGGQNFLLLLCLEIWENVNDFVINKSVTKTIYFCDIDKNELFFTYLKPATNYHCQKEKKRFLMDKNINYQVLELPKLYDTECQKSENIYSENENVQCSKKGSIEVYETLSVRNCILGFCSEKPLNPVKSFAVIGSHDSDFKVDENMLNQMYQLESQLVRGRTGIGESLLERVQMETSAGNVCCSFHCSCRHYANTESNSIGISFTETVGILASMKNLQNPHMTNAQRIGSAARKGVAQLTFASLQHYYGSTNFNSKRNIAEKPCYSSRNEMIKRIKEKAAKIALTDESIYGRISNPLPTNFNCDQHNFSQLSCGFPNNTITEFRNCPADICVSEGQCLIL